LSVVGKFTTEVWFSVGRRATRPIELWHILYKPDTKHLEELLYSQIGESEIHKFPIWESEIPKPPTCGLWIFTEARFANLGSLKFPIWEVR